ncbi:30S ribosomal protein S6 [Azospirillum halopraeferens]|uniref:30S ribosomal protein S6 n=1 Tax=Azospirillum halopraeferens TaxID=34010 RepID=UPI00041847E0|nr:30S ribosomal protein S6 [Azospirillum halopraeferens]
MALYECVLIARQDISAAQAEQLGETYAQIVRDNGGQVTKTEYWGLKTLAYKIKKNRKGHYLMLHIDAPAAAVLEMERNMGLSEDVLRYMSLRVEALDANPSVMMQSRGERGERGDRGDRGPRRFDDRGPRPPRRHEPAPQPAATAEGETA